MMMVMMMMMIIIIISSFRTVLEASFRLTACGDGASLSPFDAINIHTSFDLFAPLLTSASHLRYSLAIDRGRKAQTGKSCVK